jgi:glycosyltransferase involved in cell wall biosynthesis
MDALIFLSRLEGFGLVVAEAMASGLPVVIADSSSLTELVEHGNTGFLCER